MPRYVYVDEDGYDYGVKYPDYLSLTGNMSVGLPAADNNPFTDFLIVWPRASGGYVCGVSLTKGTQTYQIYINADGTAVHPEDGEITAACQDTIDDLLSRVKECGIKTECLFLEYIESASGERTPDRDLR